VGEYYASSFVSGFEMEIPCLCRCAGLSNVIIMRHKVFSAAVLLCVFAVSARAQLSNVITGPITNNVTWFGSNVLSGTVTVAKGVTVTVAPGAQILMNTNATINVLGRLLADGTSNAPIRFTRATTAARWSEIRFIEADDSRFLHCIIEYANSAGDHQDYYPTNCATGQGVSPRNYHEAIVALASHLDVENCTFQNMVGGAGGNEGDVFAIISDDYQFPGAASANIRNCVFTDIGQAVHTRFSYVLVQGCTFSSKNGDNDDIDMYGESLPVPLIIGNTFLSGHEDKINPTRCSAIIMNNYISGGDDHGVVLRDKGYPVVINNIFSNFTAAAISVQNQCDALIANNTIINSGRGIRMFDHTARHGPPYCLFPGNGKVTVINTILWNTPTGPVTMEASGFQPHPVLIMSHSDVQGGRNSIVTNNANCVVVWGPGNINADPLFTNGVFLRAGSPCIDAGTNAVFLSSSNWSASVTNDYLGLPRPLDGDGTNGPAYDIGAQEFFLAAGDSNSDGIPDGWAQSFGFSFLDNTVATNNADGDALNNLQEWIADTNPTNAASFFRLEKITASPSPTVQFFSSANRQYTLFATTNFVAWTNVAGQVNLPGNGALRSLTDTNPAPHTFYKVGVRVP
jgi:parallel beta-helix repeat protein